MGAFLLSRGRATLLYIDVDRKPVVDYKAGQSLGFILLHLSWRTRERDREGYEIEGEIVEITWRVDFKLLTPSLNLNYPMLRFILNSSKGLTNKALVNPSAT